MDIAKQAPVPSRFRVVVRDALKSCIVGIKRPAPPALRASEPRAMKPRSESAIPDHSLNIDEFFSPRDAPEEPSESHAAATPSTQASTPATEAHAQEIPCFSGFEVVPDRLTLFRFTCDGCSPRTINRALKLVIRALHKSRIYLKTGDADTATADLSLPELATANNEPVRFVATNISGSETKVVRVAEDATSLFYGGDDERQVDAIIAEVLQAVIKHNSDEQLKVPTMKALAAAAASQGTVLTAEQAAKIKESLPPAVAKDKRNKTKLLFEVFKRLRSSFTVTAKLQAMEELEKQGNLTKDELQKAVAYSVFRQGPHRRNRRA